MIKETDWEEDNFYTKEVSLNKSFQHNSNIPSNPVKGDFVLKELNMYIFDGTSWIEVAPESNTQNKVYI